MILKKWHKYISIIQCEQYTPNTDLVQQNECRLFCFIRFFAIGYCKYFTEKFLSSLSPELLYKLFKYMNENNNWFLPIDR